MLSLSCCNLVNWSSFFGIFILHFNISHHGELLFVQGAQTPTFQDIMSWDCGRNARSRAWVCFVYGVHFRSIMFLVIKLGCQVCVKLTAVPSVPTAASSGQLSAAASASNKSNGHRSIRDSALYERPVLYFHPFHRHQE